MLTYGERLRMYRKHAKLTQKELAEKLGVDNSLISNWERDINKYDIDMLIPLSEALDISVNDLVGFYTDYSLDPQEEKLVQLFRKLDEPDNKLIIDLAETLLKYKEMAQMNLQLVINTIQKPLYYLAVSAGTGQFLDSDDYEMKDFPEDVVPRESTFAVRVSGDSMEPDYPDGSIVFVQHAKNLNPGEVGVFVLNGDGYIKELGNDSNLISFNPRYKDIRIGEYDDLRIVGKVVGKPYLEK